MRKILQLALVIGLAAGASAQTTTRYICNNGNDSHSGTTAGTCWLTPNHALTAPAVIILEAGAYSAANFYNGKWGACTSTNGDFCWIKCATAFACTFNSTSGPAIFVSASHWGVQGMVVSGTTSSGGCIEFAPSYSTGAQIHHVIAINNIVGPCAGDGINTNNGYGTTPTTGVDYVLYGGNIAYDTGGTLSGGVMTPTSCAAGLSIYSLVPSDTLPGIHVLVDGNFAWGNVSNCGDGEGIIIDTLDGVEAGWPTQSPYNQGVAVEHNLTVWNAGPGIQVDLNENGTGPWAPIFFFENTAAYNNQGPSTADYAGQIVIGTTRDVFSAMNLAVAPTQYAFGGNTVTNYGVVGAYNIAYTNFSTDEFAYSPYGNGEGTVGGDSAIGPNNITTVNPALSNPVLPGAPSCSGYATTTACMAGVIANFAPTNSAAQSYGFGTPVTTSAFDPFYANWLCSVTNIPSGLIDGACYPWTAQ